MNDTANNIEALYSLTDIPAAGGTFRDAYISGPLDPALLARQITVAFGNSAKAVEWKNSSLTFKGLAELLCTFGRGMKDGLCMLQGALALDGGRRSSKGMKALYLLIYDLDTGLTLEQVADKLPVGICAILWTTHSHNKRESFISESAIMKELKRTTPNPTTDEAVAYLIKRTKAKPNIFEGAALSVREHTENGIGYRLQHKPWPKARVLFLLEKPFVFAERGGLQSDAIAELKARSSAFAESLGLPFDKSCTDPGRLFFTPRIPDGAETSDGGDDGLHDIWVIPGHPLDLEAVKLPPPPEKPGNAEKRAKTEPSQAEPAEGFQTANLRRFLAIASSSFRIADWLRDTAQEDVRHEYDGGQKIDARCPQEDSHTAPDDTDRGFYAINGNGDAAGFQLYCPHATCLALTTRTGKHDRGVLLDALCVYRGVSDAAELLDWCDDAARKQWAPDRTEVFEDIEPPPGAKPERLRLFAPGADRWRGKTPIPSPFVSERLVPRDCVTLLVSAGGRGKSTIGEQLMTLVATGGDFLGFKILETGCAAGVFCEDSDNTLHKRQINICRGLDVAFDDIASKVDPKSYVGSDKTLWENGKVTEFYHELDADLTAKGDVKLLVLDGTAHLYNGNEIDRGEVTRFINALTALAAKHRMAIVLITHESKSSTDSDTHAASGSTAWINACRSVLKLNWPDQTNEVRELRHIKVNDAERVKAPIRCELRDGLFVALGSGAKRMEECMQLAIGMIDQALARRQNLSPNPLARNFIAKWAASKQPTGGNFSQREFKDAIMRLISDNILAVEEYSIKGHPHKRICRHTPSTSASTSPPSTSRSPSEKGVVTQ